MPSVSVRNGKFQRLWKAWGSQSISTSFQASLSYPKLVSLIPLSYYSFSQMESDYLTPNFFSCLIKPFSQVSFHLPAKIIPPQPPPPPPPQASTFFFSLFWQALTWFPSLPLPLRLCPLLSPGQTVWSVSQQPHWEEVTMHRNAVRLRAWKIWTSEEGSGGSA